MPFLNSGWGTNKIIPRTNKAPRLHFSNISFRRLIVNMQSDVKFISAPKNSNMNI